MNQFEVYNELEQLDDEFWNLMSDRANARTNEDLLNLKNRQDNLQSWIESSLELKSIGIERKNFFLSKDSLDFDTQSNLILDFLSLAFKKIKKFECIYSC